MSLEELSERVARVRAEPLPAVGRAARAAAEVRTAAAHAADAPAASPTSTSRRRSRPTGSTSRSSRTARCCAARCSPTCTSPTHGPGKPHQAARREHDEHRRGRAPAALLAGELLPRQPSARLRRSDEGEGRAVPARRRDARECPALRPAARRRDESDVVAGRAPARGQRKPRRHHRPVPRRRRRHAGSVSSRTTATATRSRRGRPDGRTIAFASDRGTDFDVLRLARWTIALYDMETGRVRELPAQGGLNVNPQWAPDGRSIAYVSDRTGTANLFLYDLDAREHYQLTNVLGAVNALTEYSPAITWARETDVLAFAYYEKGTNNIWSIRHPRLLRKRGVPRQHPDARRRPRAHDRGGQRRRRPLDLSRAGRRAARVGCTGHRGLGRRAAHRHRDARQRRAGAARHDALQGVRVRRRLPTRIHLAASDRLRREQLRADRLRRHDDRPRRPARQSAARGLGRDQRTDRRRHGVRELREPEPARAVPDRHRADAVLPARRPRADARHRAASGHRGSLPALHAARSLRHRVLPARPVPPRRVRRARIGDRAVAGDGHVERRRRGVHHGAGVSGRGRSSAPHGTWRRRSPTSRTTRSSATRARSWATATACSSSRRSARGGGSTCSSMRGATTRSSSTCSRSRRASRRA